MKTILGLFALLLITVFILIYTRNLPAGSLFPKKNPTVTINSHSFTVTVAKTPKEQEIGLSNINPLPQDKGMLFIWNSEGDYKFWMKGVKYSLDIIFISGTKITTIINSAPALDEQKIYESKQPADKILEINGGLSAKYGFKIGDSVKIENL